MKSNKLIIVISLVAIVTLGVGACLLYFPSENVSVVNNGVMSPKDATYTIEGQTITLKNGISIVLVAPSSSSKVTTQYFGNEVTHDFDGDGRVDTVFILKQNMDGTGTFYYVVAALNTVNGYVGSHGLFLGDRIAPQTTEIGKNNIVIVNYADRKPNEGFATPPSIGKSIWLLLDPKTMQFGEIVQNFEGEADPSKMNLGMKTWNWVHTTYDNDTTVTPRTAQKFTLILRSDKSFSATTDCNGVGGEYTVSGNKITFSKIVSTKMYCESSQEQDFTKALGEAQSYLFTSKGELIFDLKFDSGSMIFR